MYCKVLRHVSMHREVNNNKGNKTSEQMKLAASSSQEHGELMLSENSPNAIAAALN